MRELHTNSQTCYTFTGSPFSFFTISLLLLILIYALPCHAETCAFSAGVGGERETIFLPNVKFKNCNNTEIATGIRMDVFLMAGGEIQDSTGNITGSWGCNYLDLNFNITYYDSYDGNDCFSGVPVQFKYQGHATPRSPWLKRRISSASESKALVVQGGREMKGNRIIAGLHPVIAALPAPSFLAQQYPNYDFYSTREYKKGG